VADLDHPHLGFYRRETTIKLGRKVEDLEDVRYLVNVLSEVRMCRAACMSTFM
jgi:hypothetical protein